MQTEPKFKELEVVEDKEGNEWIITHILDNGDHFTYEVVPSNPGLEYLDEAELKKAK